MILNTLNIILWIMGMVILLFMLITGNFAAYQLVTLLWAFPAGYAAGIAFKQLRAN